MLVRPEGECDVSRASQWEPAINIANGKLRLDLARFSAQVERDGFHWLGIESAHVLAVAKLPRFDDHQDPFDRMLVAQSLAEPPILLTAHRQLDRYGPMVRVVTRVV
ncbi:type II toxin-antitoxin system VapC family toxin [Sinimarinibacterium thermocellulolyticum]|uniref:Type II toxin-antitoxin system VapC family toxin n=1 Tax=Sinimarinibacterium thermocellulolyticum TaxID=3170016 RepID=A0ABV2A9Z7_9GAMM